LTTLVFAVPAGAALVASARIYQFGDAYFSEIARDWTSWLIEGGLSGAVIGTSSWALWRPRLRLTRAMVIAVGINCAAWTAFLVLTPPLSESEFAAIASRRAQWDPGDLVSDQATVVAGRAFNRFSLAEKPLMLTAGPAVLASTLYVVPVRYPGSLPTRNESYVIALTSLVLSSAFWITIGGVIASVRARRRRAGATRE
jgi:hypothetical protein